MKTYDFWDRSAGILLILAYLIGLLFAIATVGWQCLIWLKTGSWPSIPFLAAFQLFKVDLTLVYNPHSWFGLAKLTQWILNLPLSLTVPVCIVLAAHAWDHLVYSGNQPNQGNRQ
jgi:cellulose synthase/poly-beta-1,6-N-acetylglucosamine synthase-like glycosyltransferase